jgi:hypothetical protein
MTKQSLWSAFYDFFYLCLFDKYPPNSYSAKRAEENRPRVRSQNKEEWII